MLWSCYSISNWSGGNLFDGPARPSPQDRPATEPTQVTIMNNSVITPQIMDEIGSRARAAGSKKELLRSIDAVLNQAQIDPHDVPLESWKQIVVVATSSSQLRSAD